MNSPYISSLFGRAFLTALVCCLAASAQGQDRLRPSETESYAINGTVYNFTRRPNQIRVRLTHSLASAKALDQLGKVATKRVSSGRAVRLATREAYANPLGANPLLDLELSTDEGSAISQSEADEVLSRLRVLPDVAEAYPVYEKNGEPVWVSSTMQLSIAGRSDVLPRGLQAEVDRRGGKVTEVIDLVDHTSFIVEYPANHNVFATTRDLNTRKDLMYTSPNFEFIVHNPNGTFTPNDIFLSSQSFLSNSNDTDIDAPEAWGVTQGSSSITVAVFDDGFDLDHPDLTSKYVFPFNAASNTNIPSHEGADSRHGTACAGLVGAASNNNIGIASIGHNIMIMPVRIAITSSPGGSFTTNVATFQRAFSHVLANGANVAAVSNSIGISSIKNDPAMIDGYSSMRRNCRGGKGAVICASSGNDAAYLRGSDGSAPYIYSEVFGVGATNQDDIIASFSSFGDSLDVMAPGTTGTTSNPYVYTTDRVGFQGYSTSGDYTTFSGTSAACPIVAGLVGLVASINSNLTEAQLRAIISKTTDKVDAASGGYDLNKPHGTWSLVYGYGRVNAFAAVTSNLVLSNESSDIGVLSKLISVSPNPANDVVKIYGELSGTGSLRASVTDCIGRNQRQVIADVAGNVNLSINISDLAPGIYTLYASFGNERGQWKIVKQ